MFFITQTYIYTTHGFVTILNMVKDVTCLQHDAIYQFHVSFSYKLFVYWSRLMTFMRDITTVWWASWPHWYLQKVFNF